MVKRVTQILEAIIKKSVLKRNASNWAIMTLDKTKDDGDDDDEDEDDGSCNRW